MITNEAVAAASFDKLPERIQKLIQRCETSGQISEKSYGDRTADTLSIEELEQIAREVSKNEPVEEVA